MTGWRSRERSPGRPSRRTSHDHAVQKIALSSSRDIPFNKLVLSQSNVRRIKAGVSIEELAEDIARRTLLQSLTVRPVRDAEGVETGMFEVPAGGRRFRALELLVKQKRLAKTAPVPCVVREDGIAEEDSLAENVQRAPLHPLDQFRAFLALREKGQSEEEIAAAFFVAVSVVKQRLRLASVSPKLLDIYADDGMTLDQLMAFTVNGDHERQEQVFERLSQSYAKEPHVIRRMLTEGAVRASDKRAQFVGLDAYTEAGGVILRDLFQGDDGGWLQDVGLLDMLVAEKLESSPRRSAPKAGSGSMSRPTSPTATPTACGNCAASSLRSPTRSRRRAMRCRPRWTVWRRPTPKPRNCPTRSISGSARSRRRLPPSMIARSVFDPEEVARAGAFVSIDGSGALRIERGYVRPEDELPIAPETDAETDPADEPTIAAATPMHDDASVAAGTEPPADEPEEDDGIKPIPDRLMTELTAHRTLALRHALGEHPDIAFLAALHALCLKVFYRYAQDTCLELDLKSVGFSAQAPGLADSALAVAFDARHQAWLSCPAQGAGRPLGRARGVRRATAVRRCSRIASRCRSTPIYEAYNRKPRALAHADRLAQAVDLDMVAAGWTPTVDNYLGRVTKARILAAVREAKGARRATASST